MRLYTLIIITALMLGLSYQSESQTLDLDNPEELSAPTSQKARFNRVCVFPPQKKLEIDVEWLSPTNDVIKPETWLCRNIVIGGTNATCITAGNPDPCCTGAGTGTCDDDDMCWDTIADFVLPPAVVGLTWKEVFRTVIKNAWRDHRLSPGNDGTFE